MLFQTKQIIQCVLFLTIDSSIVQKIDVKLIGITSELSRMAVIVASFQLLGSTPSCKDLANSKYKGII